MRWFAVVFALVVFFPACSEDSGERAPAQQADADMGAQDLGEDRDAVQETGPEPDVLADVPPEDSGGDASQDVGLDSAQDSAEDDTDDAGTGLVCDEVTSHTVLLVGPADLDPVALAPRLGAMLDAHPCLEVPQAQGLAFDDPGLLGFTYRWTGRQERLAPLSSGASLVIFMDGRGRSTGQPELYFEGVRAASAIVRQAGGTPVVAMAPGDTDMSIAYRVGRGVNAPVVPAQAVLARAGLPEDQWGIALAVSLMTQVTGQAVAGNVPAPEGVNEGPWTLLSNAAMSVNQSVASAPQYEGPWEGVVRMEPLPIPQTYRFMISGTSSERGFRGQMRALLGREGVNHTDVDIGSCNPTKTVDETCLQRALTHFEAGDYMTLYARGYEVTADRIREAGSEPQLLVHIYDRHWDSTPNDGVEALDDIERRVGWIVDRARQQGVDWIPQHLAFARLKQAFPQENLLSDGVHATNTVQAGLACMVYVARTGLSPTTEGLGDEMAGSISGGERLIRQMATMSEAGVHLEDDPQTRPSLR